MLPKVSIVVPIYNVEKYIARCINSIINQTYENIEIILVDDGSPDNCGKISDEYSKKDNRVKSVHKVNGGLSDARNYGMKYVTGEYTLFLDSDDWIKGNIIETLVDVIIKNNADIVQSAFYYAYDDYLLLDNRYYEEDIEPIILNNEELMRELVINERVKNFAWGKLYKTNLIKNIEFKKGVLFEDVFWAHKVMAKVKKYVIVNKPMCYYMQREDSIVATYTLKNLDMLSGLEERHKFIESNYNNLINESYKIILKSNLMHYNLLLANKDKDANGINRGNIENYIKKNYENIKNSVKEDKSLKRQLYLFNLCPYLNILESIANKILREMKIVKAPKSLKRIENS